MRRLHSLLRKIFPCFQSSTQESRRAPIRQNALGRRRKEAMIQCSLYVLAYFASYISATIYQLLLRGGTFNYFMCIMAQLFTPSQGLFNFFVFLRPRAKSLMISDRNLTKTKAFWKAVTTRESIANLTEARRRRSLQDTQQNGGRRYTAREFHMRELREQATGLNKTTELKSDGTPSIE